MSEKNLPFTSEQLEYIIRDFPTPFHIYDEQSIIVTAQAINNAFSWCEGFKQFFAVKATPNPSILKILSRQGFGADCSSLPELMIAEKCGVYGKNIMFTSNNTPKEEYKKAMELGAIINIDDISHIKLLEEELGLPDLMCLRYNPGQIKSGNTFLGEPENSKFGMTKAQLFEGYRMLKEKGVSRFGLHTMISTQVLDANYFVDTARRLFELVIEISSECNIQFEFVNIGGGIGIPYSLDEKAVDIHSVGYGIKRAYEKVILANNYPTIKIYTEFGRVVTGPSGYFVSKVLHKKKTYKQYIGVDASMANLMRIGMYGLYHYITVMGKEHLPTNMTYDITGSLCENNDRFAINRKLPEIEVGDTIVIHDTGAHGFAMGFNYNGKLRSKELLLRPNGEVIQIRRAETVDDYFSTLNFNVLSKL
ncbi:MULTISPECIES: diaminopimelate decarboxylase family protein [Paenibacillus]|uniref:diaminopimelate decarboxylase family protein n=1 Tax=Paenibacillus TaxID=44249 RepID=UPI0013E9655A|nr:diaminopimelate decarboxylase [Paenibacillus sp. EKM211P]KAF6582686.1 diaminopimelate decarboxylase [Paenibacillus sp. EKM211P]MEE4562230.1 diaminopimelate decarboxylase [Paenibacillus polymyxa]